MNGTIIMKFFSVVLDSLCTAFFELQRMMKDLVAQLLFEVVSLPSHLPVVKDGPCARPF
jgi:hypothetical protein